MTRMIADRVIMMISFLENRLEPGLRERPVFPCVPCWDQVNISKMIEKIHGE
jgi:hypothetical protein